MHKTGAVGPGMLRVFGLDSGTSREGRFNGVYTVPHKYTLRQGLQLSLAEVRRVARPCKPLRELLPKLENPG